ncbi:hypothetical protein BP5796_02675 [Coleophoma crateriformis]|uniref:Uncharacterized protein n=1 Tax=Coleophoma crateriformis TaxID=565419 RepID=A0A3D8SYZ8_9HELO|nr:hypothetical protein BP5796_02675 [Coleophoma crateriformis]
MELRWTAAPMRAARKGQMGGSGCIVDTQEKQTRTRADVPEQDKLVLASMALGSVGIVKHRPASREEQLEAAAVDGLQLAHSGGAFTQGERQANSDRRDVTS